MPMKRIFHGGIIVTEDGPKKADLMTDGDKIAKIGHEITDPKAEMIDISGSYLFPGFIDGHTHLDLEVANTVTADDFLSGTIAALAGGTTCVVDFATQNKGESLHLALDNWHKKADTKASCDYSFHLAISDWNEKVKKELPEIVKGGVHSFKLYMIYDAMFLTDKEIFDVMHSLKKEGAIVAVHCEDRDMINEKLNLQKEKRCGFKNVLDYPDTRPDDAEAEAIKRILNMAGILDTPIIIVHLSSKKGLAVVEKARKNGQKVYVETCPQYLLLDRKKYQLPNEEARLYMMAPPLRTKEDNIALWEALTNDAIQTIGTDHCSFTAKQKNMGEGDFMKTPCGIPGLQERAQLLYNFGVVKKKISLEQMNQYLSENPAKLYHLYPRKGVLAKGSDADLVIWDPEHSEVIANQSRYSRAGYTPYEGAEIKGRVKDVYLRGEQVVKNGKVIVTKTGKYIPASL